MKISLNWLKKYIDLDLSVDRLSEILTDIGLEVEGVDTFESIKGGFEGIVIGEVLEAIKHPNADKLKLTKVNIGAEDSLQIVCGAPNVAEGQKVLVATIGTTLYTAEGEPWKIKKGKIRGELSEGMICAEDELGIGTDHSGIMILPDSAEVGTEARKYFELKEDHVFDIGLTPNRSDATSHLGVAKDLAAYLKINEDWNGTVQMPDLGEFKSHDSSLTVNVELVDEERCPRYTGVSLSGIKLKPSPDWMQNYLKAVDVRPINNIVDITNFVLHEYGQPLHAFDHDKIAHGKIIVKTLPQDTSFLSLDEQERKLDNEDLMICDGDSNPMCIGGVFGGLNSGVTDATQNIFLEAAHFNASSIRRSSTRHLLRTDAAKVFEKGSDPNKTVDALKRAVYLMIELADATISSEIIDIYPTPIEPLEILLKYSNVSNQIGNKLESEEIHNILRAMGMELKPLDENGVLVRVPTDKADVVREVDLIEEILRIYGFNKVAMPQKMSTTIIHKSYPTKRQIQNQIANHLASNGFNEMMGISLVESKMYNESEHDKYVFINNTSNIHLDMMRPDALLSGLKSVAHNLNHRQSNLSLFEFGRVYKQSEDFVENEFMSIFISGHNQSENWNVSQTNADYFNLKKWVHEILAQLTNVKYEITESDSKFFDYGICYKVNDSNLVEFGKLNSAVLKKMSISQDVYFALFDFESYFDLARKSVIETKEISKYPSTRRDLALVIDDSIDFDRVLDISQKIEKKLIKEIGLFDIYKNEEQLGKGKKSYAVKFIFQDNNKTLKDKEVDKVMNKLIQSFERELGAVIRS